MSATNSASVNAADVDEANPLEQSTITMLDVLEEEKELEEEYAAVLGGSDEKECTYAKGAIQRQALYSCLTCCPEARDDPKKSAGVCLACSYKCHENHELIELYTRRNFRCDCPTLEKRCALNPQLEAVQPKNANNLYNHNFQGVYCKCKRPYPDPERTTEETMLQCVICEDWFHLQHMEAPAGSEKLSNACSEMICDCCMERHEFLRDYSGLALQPAAGAKESATEEINVVDSHPTKNEQQSEQQSEQPAEKRLKLSDDACRRPKSSKEHKGAAFWANDWRKALCRCGKCLELYKEQSVEFLLDAEDSVEAYEKRGMKRIEENSSYEQGIRALASIDRTKQIDVITEYNRMGDKLKEFLQSFAANKKVVTEDDIKRFFAGMQSEKSTAVSQPYFCR
ncbi:PREDICTED: putative E3 ubiquitin-protein ligase UBR7 [Drosophila arizonae]|uniref:E3 ubiquitin-protein ligase UBR7 n=1 Tax=Drosophila arizonae TaxID=7263 RepID=A0ABM1NUF8_DROAR|nr:PREDICTED: putative E3 ubiquitin-protein ligase UBR7 [Drosophila arizonae]